MIKRSILIILAIASVLAGVAQTETHSGQTPERRHRDYFMQSGHLWYKPYQQLFFNMGMHEIRTDTLHIYNQWTRPMQLGTRELPDFLKIEPVPAILAPESYGYLLITYDASKRNDYDLVVDKFTLITNDTLQPLKTMELLAVITEDFSELSERDLRNSPVIKLNTNHYHFGTISQGSIARYTLQVTNEGKDTLHLRKITSSCGCTTGKPDKTTLGPMETANIQISFNTFGRTGRQSKSVTIISNDPANTHQVFTIEGTIEKRPGEH